MPFVPTRKVGVKKTDEEDIRTRDLAFPAHTNARKLVKEIELLRAKQKKNLNVIFSTYQSIAVISDAQNNSACRNLTL